MENEVLSGKQQDWVADLDPTDLARIEARNRRLTFAKNLEDLANNVETNAFARAQERAREDADKLEAAANRVEGKARAREEAIDLEHLANRVEGRGRAREEADRLERVAVALEARALIDIQEPARSDDKAEQRDVARNDLVALHEIRDPVLLDQAAEVIAEKMLNPTYRDEFQRVDPEATAAIDKLKQDGGQFEPALKTSQEMSIDDVTLERLEAARNRDRLEALRSLGADRDTPVPPTTISEEQRESTQAKRGADRADEGEIPVALQKKYLHHDHKFFYRDDGNKLAFEDQGKRLTTPHNDPEVAKSMVDMAIAKGWDSLVLKGTDEFKREAWLQAQVKGIEVKGFEPQPADIARLNDKLAESNRPSHGKVNAVENGTARNTSRSSEAAPQKSERVVDESRQVTPQQEVAIKALEAIMRDRGDSDKAIEAATRIATERFQEGRVYVGKVLEHGAAPYENDPQNERSYYVKLATAQGEKTVWGKDLARAVEEGNVQKDQEVAITHKGRTPVEVTAKVANEKGELIPTKIVTNRNAWDVTQLSKMRDEAKAQVASLAKMTDKQPLVKAYDTRAPKPVQTVKFPDQKRTAERAR